MKDEDSTHLVDVLAGGGSVVCGVRGLDAGLVEDGDHGAAAAGQLGLLLHHRVGRLNSEQPVSRGEQGDQLPISRESVYSYFFTTSYIPRNR
jgi:hypothetical protein